MGNRFVEDRERFGRFVAAWEAGTLPKAEWTHAAHVSVGGCYAIRYGEEALARIREGIQRYNAAVGTANTETSGYHETLTRFWVLVLRAATRGFADEWLAARHAVNEFGERRNLHAEYYSFDVVASREARRDWIAPDLRSI